MMKETTKALRKDIKDMMIFNHESTLYVPQILLLMKRYGVSLTEVDNVRNYFHYSKPQAKFRASLGE